MQQPPIVETCNGPVAQQMLQRARDIRLLICDVDDVMSDGLIYMGNYGEELKAFNVRDGYGIRCLLTSGALSRYYYRPLRQAAGEPLRHAWHYASLPGAVG